MPVRWPRRHKVVIRKLGDDDALRDYKYWMSRPPEERIAAMEELRLHWHKMRNEPPARLQRVLRVIKSKVVDKNLVIVNRTTKTKSPKRRWA